MEEFILLATPKIHSLYYSDIHLLEKLHIEFDKLLSQGIHPSVRRFGFMSYGVQAVPPLTIAFLASGAAASPDFLIFSGTGDGLGPTDDETPCLAKGIFPSKAKIRSGEWHPLIQMHFV